MSETIPCDLNQLYIAVDVENEIHVNLLFSKSVSRSQKKKKHRWEIHCTYCCIALYEQWAMGNGPIQILIRIVGTEN